MSKAAYAVEAHRSPRLGLVVLQSDETIERDSNSIAVSLSERTVETLDDSFTCTLHKV